MRILDEEDRLPRADRHTPLRSTRRKKTDRVADHIKRWIMLERLGPGERLPTEESLVHRLGVSRGTIREALKSLEVQGLIELKAGRGGGPRVLQVSDEISIELLANHFYSREMSIQDIYQVRKMLEPEMAAEAVGRLGSDDLDALEQSLGFCSCEPASTATRREQRMSELDFHDVLARACPNPLLAFNCRFLNSLLRHTAVCRKIYSTHETADLASGARDYHRRLIAAYRDEDADAVRRLMREHMEQAEAIMAHYETIVESRFIMSEGLLDAASF